MTNLHKAAQAVVDRWDTPLWKDVPAMAVYINILREALAQPEQEPVAWMSPGRERLEFSRKDTVYGSHTIPLYRHPAPVPEGWQLVPIEPTDEMLINSYRPSVSCTMRKATYKDMLAAAPKLGEKE